MIDSTVWCIWYLFCLLKASLRILCWKSTLRMK